MNILNIEGDYFVPAFRAAGHQVLCLGLSGNPDILLNRPLYYPELTDILRQKEFTPDMVLWADCSNLPFVFGCEALPALNIGFSIDQFCHPWHVPYSATHDLTLVAQKEYLPLFTAEKDAAHVHWFPLFFCPPSPLDLTSERDIPVCFVGTLRSTNVPSSSPLNNPARVPFLNAFKKHCPIIIHQGAYIPIFLRSRIALNQSAAGEVNFRVFEAAGCGAAVLTEDVGNGLRELFTPGLDILPPYPRGDAAAAARLAQRFLAEPERLAAIAAAGQAKVMAEHTVEARARALLQLAEQGLRRNLAALRLARLHQVRAQMEKAFYFIALELDNTMHKDALGLYSALARDYGAKWDQLRKSRE